MKFVIIGGDAAGMSAASRAKRNNPDIDVIVLEQTKDVSYSACGMPYNIANSERKVNDLIVREAHVFRDKQGIDLRTGHCVESIDREAKRVFGTDSSGKDFSVSYDKLLIATGALPIIPDLPGFNLPGVMSLKKLEDARRIKEYIRTSNVKTAVIIGMGYIAMEMAEALRALDIDVQMIKPRSELLPWMNSELSDMVRKELEKNEVKLHLGYEVKSIESASRGLKVVSSMMTLECQMVILAIGIIPNSTLALDAKLELGPKNVISVDKTLKTSDENIYAAGDCADAYHVVTGKKTWIPLALRANRGGWAVADNIAGRHVEIPDIAGTAVFKVFDLEVARTGLSMDDSIKDGFEPVEAMITSRTRAHVFPGGSEMGVQIIGDKKSGLLLGMQIVAKEGAAHRINAPAVALHSKLTVEEFSRTDLAYAPPFGPTWDPMLTASNQLLKKMT